VRTTDPRSHERIEELLAGYALRSLSGEDAAEADRLLAGHVPTCLSCRRLLPELTETVADLAFAADPVAPPETLLPRLHRQLEPRTRRRLSGRAGIVASVAVAVVAVGVAFSQGLRMLDLERRSDLVGEVLQYLQRPGATTDRLNATSNDATSEPMAEVVAPEAEHFYLVGTDVPPPPEGAAYGVWLSDGVEAVYVGELPWGPGVRVIKVPFDRSRFDRVLVTIEDAGEVAPSQPGAPVWTAEAA
jgi:Anti-sigma-K factor rskA